MKHPQLLFLGLLSAMVSACAALPPVNKAGVRVMSYNIRLDVKSDNPNWTERREPMARQVAFNAPDVLGLQEALPAQVAWLAAQWPDFDHYGLGRDDGVNGESTTMFWRKSRFDRVEATTQWCSRTPSVPGKDYDAAYPRTITRLILRDRLSGRLYDVRNTHFDHVGVAARGACARQILAMPVHAKASVIIMGDFNTGPTSEPYQLLTADTSGLKDARTLAAIDFGPPGTFNDFHIGQTGGEPIDHIFVGQKIAVKRFGVLTDSFGGKVISDHFPIVADLAF